MRFHRPRVLTTRPTVSVVIPCYNYGHYLGDAVASALDQDGLDVDVLVVDDASTDDSAAVARELAAEDPRVDVLVHEENAGHIRTYNDGLAKASGDYVVLLSADDLLARNSLSRSIALMETHPSVGLVYGYARSFTDRPATSHGRARSWSVWPGRQWLGLAARTGRCFLASPEAVMRREALFETDLYDPRLPHSGDFDMWLRTAARWDIGRVNGPVQAHYRVHEANMHLTSYSGWATDLRERRRTFEILVEERAAEVPEVVAMREVAMAALAGEAVRRARDAQRAGGAPDEVSGLLDFARETHPGSAPAVLRDRPLPAPDLVRRAAHHARWRFERRYGV